MSRVVPPEVETRYGRVRGAERHGVRSFLGIPYAAAPVGERRFAAPARAERWDGVRDATRHGAACPQPKLSYGGSETNRFAELFGAGDLRMDEDCLNLNVFAPTTATPSDPKPVMVWIHGGAFRIGTGASPLYDGSSLARSGDVLVVSINYRLGVLGFLNLNEVGPANAGLLDQIAALRWVQEEIAAFGGDPGNVTIFGESAGAKSVECLAASPLARGLFRRAIAQSTYESPMDPEPAAEAARAVLADLGVSAGDRRAVEGVEVDDLIDAMTRQSMAAMGAGGGFLGALGGWSPVVDGEVLPQRPVEAFAAGDASDIPMILGTTRDEAGLFTAMMPMLAAMEEAALPAMLGMLLGDTTKAEHLVATYRQSRGEAISPVDVFVAAMTDRAFRQHSLRVAEAKAAHQADTWMYIFDWCALGEGGSSLGACHALEIPFVFGTLDSPLGKLAGKGAEAEVLVEAMQGAWAAFARGGDPSTRRLEWPRFDTERRRTATFGPKVEVREAPLDEERRAWASLAAR
ncbi:MAG TPA: carboxylesterase/lipase family protein [Tepidiformaceae bacterium]|nr:carboxylesterase/lipase family protein [Tepidiformaceae bacterium]